MNHRWCAYSFCAALAACGSPKVTGNDAADGGSSAFSEPRAATASEIQAAQGLLAPALGLQGVPDLTQLVDLANLPTLVSQLLGDPSANPLSGLSSSPDLASVWQGVGGNLGPLLQGALASGCVSLTSAGVAFNNCAVPFQQSAVQGTVQVDGLLSLSSSGLKLDLSVVGAFDAASASGALKLHLTGDLGASGGACKGAFQVDVSLDGTLGGTCVSLALSEALSLNLGYQSGQLCASAGTVLAVRQWNARPDGQSSVTLPDLAAKLDFSACGAATIAFSPKAPSGP